MYNFHIDPGHGWLEVPFVLLRELGIQKDISSYSYRFNGTCYLEEDCDAPKFIAAMEKRFGGKVTFKEVYHDRPNSPECYIRNLNSYWA